MGKEVKKVRDFLRMFLFAVGLLSGSLFTIIVCCALGYWLVSDTGLIPGAIVGASLVAAGVSKL